MAQWVKNPPVLQEMQAGMSSGWEGPLGHDNRPRCSCLGNPRDRGAWWATAHSVTQSWTRVKRLSIHASIQLLESTDYIPDVVQ